MAKSSLGPDIHAERLLKTELVLLARAGHPRAHATDLAELAGCEWVHGARPDELDPIIVETFRKANLAPPRFVAQWDSFSAMTFLLLQSDYLSLASGPAAEPFCREGLLTRIALQPGLGLSTQLLLTPANRPLTPHAKLFAAELLKAARMPQRR
jgi:DNA-binding transcriptional LysR family regulator